MPLPAGCDHAQVDPRDEHGRTPLHLAARYGYGVAVRLLVQAGASVVAEDEGGRTPADVAHNGGIGAALRAIQTRKSKAMLVVRTESEGGDGGKGKEGKVETPRTPSLVRERVILLIVVDVG